MKKKKKIPFPGRRQHMEQEPGKLLLIHAKLHSQHRTVFLCVFHPFHTAPTSRSHIQYTPYTHPPQFQRICTRLFWAASSYTLCIQRNTLIPRLNSASILGCDVPYSLYWPTQLCHKPSLVAATVPFVVELHSVTVYLATTLQFCLCQ